MELDGKVALVTGGSKGIGRQLALDLGRDGATVLVAARSQAHLLDVVEVIREEGGSAQCIQLDVGDLDQVRSAFEKIMALHDRLDMLFTCAAIAPWGRVTELDPRRVEEVIRVNLIGTAWCVQAALPIMLNQNSGTLVAFSSHSAALPMHSAAPYCASKAGIVAFMEAVYTEVHQSGINVHVVFPAIVPDTEMAAEDISHRGRPPSLAVRSAADVSKAVLAAVGRRTVRISLPRGSGAAHVVRAMAPSASLRLLAHQ